MDRQIGLADAVQRHQHSDEISRNRGIGSARYAKPVKAEGTGNQDRVQNPVEHGKGNRDQRDIAGLALSAQHSAQPHLEQQHRHSQRIGAHILLDQRQQFVTRLHQPKQRVQQQIQRQSHHQAGG